MTLFTRTLLAATIVAGTTFASVATVQAGCGGSRRSFISHRPRINYAPRPVYHPPAPAPCTQPVYQQPVYQQPVYQRPISQPGFQQPIGQPGLQQPVGQPGQQQPQQFAGQPTQPAQQRAPQAQAANPAAPQATQPQAGNTNPGNTAPANTNPANSAQMTALQALAGMSAIPAAAPQTPAQPQQPSQVGTWNATLANGARVQLNLQADGSFNWSATNKAGRTSTFGGSYTVSGGNLTLIRSNDNQKLAGALAQNGTNAFNFKLAGASDGGLNFVRS
jgi:hypothetical protein